MQLLTDICLQRASQLIMSQNNDWWQNRRCECRCRLRANRMKKLYNNRMKREIKNMKMNLALHSVHIKMMKRGLLTAKDFIQTLAVSLILLLSSSTALYAQQEAVGELIREIEAQGETRLNAGVAIDRSEVVTQAVSPYFMRDAVEQVLAGSDYTPQFDTFVFPRDYFPRFSMKTNLLYAATTTPNIGVEFFLNKWLTLDIAAGWNPFRHRDNRKFAHWSIQPTLRYWIQEPFNGFFVGLSLLYANFNVSGIPQPYNWLNGFPGVDDTRNRILGNRLALWGDDGYRFRGDAYGASLQFGHQWVLSPRWSIEAFANVGYMFLDYQVWEGGWCGRQLPSETRHYFGLTNAGISLIYIFR